MFFSRGPVAMHARAINPILNVEQGIEIAGEPGEGNLA
jgi:hypothetical protein